MKSPTGNKIFNVVINDDCRDGLKCIKSESFDLIIADPPYRIKSWEGFGSKHDKSYGVEPPEYAEWLPECTRLLKVTGSIIIFETPMNMFDLKAAMEAAGLTVQPPLCWFVNFRKSHPRKGYYNSHWEPMMWGTKTDKWYFDSKPLRGGGSHYGGDVYEAPAIMRAKVPGQKPPKLIERLIAVHTPPEGDVFDPFGGSGTSALAAMRLGRSCITIEVDKELCDHISCELQKLTEELNSESIK
jgi:DNA modification methylase